MGIKYKELKNTYNLPSGDPLRRVLVKFFREQRKAFNDWLAAEQRKLAPFQLDRRVLLECKLFPPVKFPGWEHLGLGAKVLQKRILPVIEPVWESSGTKTLSRLRSARAKKLRRKDLSLDFSVTNPKIKQAIEEATLRFSQETNDTTSLDLEDALAQVREDLESGMESGDTISEIADNIKDVFDKAEDFRAERIAATETSRAYHQAQMLADEESGVVPGYEWLASEDACQEICQAIMEEAQYIKAGTPFAIVDDDPDYGTIYFPPAHPNCCLPGTRIVAPLAVAGLEVHYEGPVVRLRFDNGADLTVTSNHMLLTVDGFARVSSLMEGDDIIRYCGPIHSDFIGNTKDYDCPATIQQVVNSLSESSGSVTRYVSAATNDLHGDGTFSQGDIRVVISDRFPGGCCDAEQLEMAVKSDFVSSDTGNLHFLDYCLLVRILWNLFSSTKSLSGFDRDQHSLIRAQLRMANVLSLESVPAFDTCSFKAVFDDRPGDTEHTRDGMLGLATLIETDDFVSVNNSLLNPSSGFSLSGLHRHLSFNESISETIRGHADRLSEVADRFPGQITTCKITNIDVLHYSGPVYDVQTLPTLYLIDRGIVSSNCQCTYVEVLDTDDPQPEWGETYIAPPKGGKKKSFVSIPWKREESLIEVGLRALEAIESKFNSCCDKLIQESEKVNADS